MEIKYIEQEKTFMLSNGRISYAFSVEKNRYLMHGYFGRNIQNYRGISRPYFYDRGFCSNPIPEERTFSLDTLPQEYPDMNQGDFRSPAYVIQTEDGRRVTRFYYKNYRIIRGKPILPGLPSVYTEDDEEALTLCVELEDKTMNAGIALYYTIFRDYDAVCRHVEVINAGKQELYLHPMYFSGPVLESDAQPLRELMEKEQVQVEEKALRYIAKTADGSMRDALSLLDQCIAFHFGQELTYDKALDVLGAVDTEVFSRLLRHVIGREVNGCIGLLEEIVMQGRELSQFVTDFTWYLRNLLLLQSSDDIEDIIDVSSDNLVRLKEEAGMLETETLMRYIRIFSELSGQIKYAPQKRILIEIALIKLCRPDMERDIGSVAERVRVIEEQLENGVVAVAAAGAVESVSAPVPAKEHPPLPKAISEDVQAAVERWQDIVAGADMPMKQYLKEARLSLGGDSQLLVVVEDGLASDYFLRQEGHKKLLEQMLADMTGREIDVTVQTVPDRGTFEQSYVDLSQLIHMEIEEE